MFTDSEKQLLLRVVRDSIEAAVKGIPPPRIEGYPESLAHPCGVFVTLREDKELRGCIGYVEPIKPLIEAVQEVAAKAALEDPRFDPLSARELVHVEIEISVLSPMRRIRTLDEIEIGKHGLIIELGDYRGLMLPQVATEHGWDLETFLSQTARKTGLPSTGWKDPDARIYTFTAEIIGEHSSTLAHG